jgi:hypothetical protein
LSDQEQPAGRGTWLAVLVIAIVVLGSAFFVFFVIR